MGALTARIMAISTATALGIALLAPHIAAANPPNSELKINIKGTPTGTPIQITITGPNGYTKNITRRTTLKKLTPGTYKITAKPTTTTTTQYAPLKRTQSVKVRPKRAKTVHVIYTTKPLPPQTPTNPTATAANSQATINWTPAQTGGTPTSYTATSTPGGLSCTTGATTCTITKLTNGTPYTFTITAQNSAGTSPPSQPTTTVTPLSCQLGGTCRIGDTGPGGGLVYYATPTRQPWGQYLEVAPTAWSGTIRDPKAPWGCQQTRIYYLSRDIGTGLSNTNKIIAGCPETGTAAHVARNYQGGGKTDWFLPSPLELTAMQPELALIGELEQDGYYWSSAEWGTSDAIYYYFSEFSRGVTFEMLKSSKIGVRPIRAF